LSHVAASPRLLAVPPIFFSTYGLSAAFKRGAVLIGLSVSVSNPFNHGLIGTAAEVRDCAGFIEARYLSVGARMTTPWGDVSFSSLAGARRVRPWRFCANFSFRICLQFSAADGGRAGWLRGVSVQERMGFVDAAWFGWRVPLWAVLVLDRVGAYLISTEPLFWGTDSSATV